MWAVRILTGSQAGQIFTLTGGKHLVGRGSGCTVRINSNSVSKEHAAILVTGDKLIITDLNSRNGTFVNGVRIQNQRMDVGDKISLHDVLLDILKIPDELRNDSRPLIPRGGSYTAPPPSWAGNTALQLHNQQQHLHHRAHGYPQTQMGQSNAPHSQQEDHQHGQQMSAHSIAALFQNFKIYIDNVAMPGVYTIVKSMPFHYAIGAMIAIYAAFVTAFGTGLSVSATKNNIRQESMRRAQSIANNMAAVNQQAVIQDNETRMSVRQAELEEGVTTAVIIREKDGTIMAPANKRGEFVNKPFVNKARREQKKLAEFIDDSTIGVSIPFTIYSPENGNQNVIAYAVVLYDMGASALNATRTFQLFIQTLVVALLVGFILYFFLHKIFQNPIESLNIGLDDALREGRDDITTDYQIPPLEKLISNINSALSRIDRSGGAQHIKSVINRDIEAANIMRMVAAPAIVVNAIDERIIATNQAFDRLVGGGVNLTSRPLTDIPDVALQENLRDLIPRMRSSASEIALGEIPFAGMKYEINGHAIMGAEDPAYFLIVINPVENNG